MAVVWKYPFGRLTTGLEVDLPAGAQPLRVDWQNPGRFDVCLWALVPDPKAPTVKRKFAFVGTGAPIDDDLKIRYLNTFLSREHDLVFHAFEVVTP
jgi:hypothetical protein